MRQTRQAPRTRSKLGLGVLVVLSVSIGCARVKATRGPQAVLALEGSIYTVAGTGRPGFNGEGLSARESELFWPDDLAIASDGTLCIIDWNNHRVRLRRADGTLVTALGTGLPGDGEGPADEALINHPTNATWDTEGRLIVACWHNHKIKRVEPDGSVTTICGDEPGFSGDGGPASQALLKLPSAVHRMADGSLLILDSGNQRLRSISADGTITTVAGTGTRGYWGDGGDALDAEFAFPDDGAATPGGKLALARDGSILIADAGNNVIRRIGPDWIIETVAGTGVQGFSEDGTIATEAVLSAPVDVAEGPDGLVYFAERDANRVRRVNAQGLLETVAGGHVDAPDVGEHEHDPFDGDGGPAHGAPLHAPSGIEFDRNGNLYIASQGSHTIRVVVSSHPGHLMLPPRPTGQGPIETPDLPPTMGTPGTIETVAGTGKSGFNGDGLSGLETDFYWPIAVVKRPTGELIVSDWNNHRVRMVRQDGLVVTLVGNGFPGDGQGHSEDISIFHATGIALGPDDDRVAVAAWHNQKVKVHSFLADAVVDVAGTSVPGYSGDGTEAVEAQLSLPSSVAWDPAGNLYVTDEGNARIRRIRPDGIIETFAGNGVAGYSGDGGPAVESSLGFAGDDSGRPSSFLATDPSGRVLVADTLNHRVRRIELDGTISTVAGSGFAGYSGDGGPALEASLHFPVAVAVSPNDGAIYISDRDNHAVRKVAPDGTITTIAGNGAPGFSGDGGDSAAAQLSDPHGLTVDAQDNVFVADLGNGRVRAIWGGHNLWKGAIHPLFKSTCATANCHSGPRPAGNLGLEDGASAYQALIGKAAYGYPSRTLVVPGDSSASYLYQKLDPTTDVRGDRMPARRLPLPDRELSVIRAWIDGGAKP